MTQTDKETAFLNEYNALVKKYGYEMATVGDVQVVIESALLARWKAQQKQPPAQETKPTKKKYTKRKK